MKIGRNDVCYCGSGKKYKKCCMNKGVVQKVGVGKDLKGEMIKCKSVRECKEKMREWNSVYKNNKENISGSGNKILGEIIKGRENKSFEEWVKVGLDFFKKKYKGGEDNSVFVDDWVEFFRMVYMNDDNIRDVYDLKYYLRFGDELFIDKLRGRDKMYNVLGNKIKVYRGVCLDNDEVLDKNDLGVSWSIVKNVGVWYSRRWYSFIKSCKGYLISGEVDKEDVVMCVSDLDEEEIIVKGDIKNILVEEVKMIENIGSWRDIKE